MDFNLKRYSSQSDDGYWTSSESIYDSPSFPQLKDWAYHLSTSKYWDVYDGYKDQTSTYHFVRAAFVY